MPSRNQKRSGVIVRVTFARTALFALHAGSGSISGQGFGELTLTLVRGAEDDVGAAVIPLEVDGLDWR